MLILPLTPGGALFSEMLWNTGPLKQKQGGRNSPKDSLAFESLLRWLDTQVHNQEIKHNSKDSEEEEGPSRLNCVTYCAES